MLEKIKSRYSCREFRDQEIEPENIEKILECGRWAPSGLNNQPWRFIVIQKNDDLKIKLATLTTSEKIITQSKVNIVVLLDLSKVYSKTKDILGIGACIENMLLAAHELGYGTCWLGEILNKSDKVLELLELNKEDYELMAVISIGVALNKTVVKRKRMELDDLIIKRL